MKPVKLSTTLSFPSISSAKLHFDPMRSEGPLDVDVPTSQFEELKLLYVEYCRKTAYQISSEIAGFFPTMENRDGGYTRCLAARFADGSIKTFSLDKALSTVSESS